MSGFTAAAVLIGGGLWWHGHLNGQKNKNSINQTVGNHLISLDQSSTPADSGGLSVSGSGANDLGQLGDNQSSQGSGTKPSGANSNGDVDPSTFSQYDKYQSSQNALFGDIQKGSGTELAAGQKASIDYKVWLTSGALIDQSPVSPGGQPQAYSFTLGNHQVILGLEEGVAGMKTGGKRLVIVPPAVGYGSKGQGVVPPDAVLVFEVELLSVQ